LEELEVHGNWSLLELGISRDILSFWTAAEFR
jgi:hypothetical protein